MYHSVSVHGRGARAPFAFEPEGRTTAPPVPLVAIRRTALPSASHSSPSQDVMPPKLVSPLASPGKSVIAPDVVICPPRFFFMIDRRLKVRLKVRLDGRKGTLRSICCAFPALAFDLRPCCHPAPWPSAICSAVYSAQSQILEEISADVRG